MMIRKAPRHPPPGDEFDASPRGSTIALLESLIERVQDCERAFDLTQIARGAPHTNDIVFIDDLADVLAGNATVNELCADSASMALAARYSAMVKAALHVLLQIRQLHCDRAAAGETRQGLPAR
ncbi:MAG: hypothetical protein M5U33_09875 [Pseudorhodoplanes sp.]|nr:hypothetical protein [Pseudorhodoplanes sp.]